jgi:uncharacterized phage protein (TIGR02220 family)
MTIIRTPQAITTEPWYPRDRKFTEFEARMDFIYHRGLLTPTEAAARWSWSSSDVAELWENLNKEGTLSPPAEWYEKETKPAEVAKEILTIWMHVFGKKVALNDYRIRMINGRIKEGRNNTPPTGPKQFAAVFKYMKEKWTGTDMEGHLKIETLCAAKHFQKYLEEARDAYMKQSKATTTGQEEGIRLPGKLIKEHGPGQA